MTTLTDIFNCHLTSDKAQARKDITVGILASPRALRELEAHSELWLCLPVETLSNCLSEIYNLRGTQNSGLHAFGIREQQVRGFTAIEILYMGAIEKWIDEEFEAVNWARLKEEENVPEPGDAA